MNLVQTQLLKAKGYEFDGTKLRAREAGGQIYVAVAFRNGKRAEASGRTVRDAEGRLVMSITAPGDDRNVEQWKREEQFLKRMWKRYGLK